MILHAGITLRRSKRLKSQLYSPLIALSRFSEFIAASRRYITPLAGRRCPSDNDMGVRMGAKNGRSRKYPQRLPNSSSIYFALTVFGYVGFSHWLYGRIV